MPLIRDLFSPLRLSKFISKSRAKRLPLTTKRAGKGFYKGNRARKEGHINSKGQFRLVRDMCTELVVPDLTGFKLKPYVAATLKKDIRAPSPSTEEAIAITWTRPRAEAAKK